MDVYIHSLLLGIEFDGHFYHQYKGIQDKEKNKSLHSNGIQLIRIREKPLKEIKVYSCINYLVEPNNFSDLEKSIISTINYILENYTLNEEIKLSLECTKLNLDIKRDRFKIYEQYSLVNKKNNLNEIFPEIAKEWHPTKNGKLKPYHVTRSSNKVVWWVCDKNHEYQSEVNRRTSTQRKGGCPYCSGKRVNSKNCLAIMNPNLTKEWHPIFNQGLTPFDVVSGSHKKAWWICSVNSNHVWEAIIDSRNRGNGCPFCAGKKIGLDNSFLAKNPEAAKLWHHEKNRGLSPSDVAPNSSLRVWLKCTNNPNHEWEAIVSNINKGRGCPECAKVVRTQKSLEKKAITQYKRLQRLASENDGFLISSKYLGSRDDHEWKCKRGHVFKMKPRQLIEGHSWCPKCRVIK